MTLSGVNGGTRIGPPLDCASKGWAAPGGGPEEAVIPSNFGRGPPAMTRCQLLIESGHFR